MSTGRINALREALVLFKAGEADALARVGFEQKELVELIGWVIELSEHTTLLLKKLDVVLPQFKGIATFHALRSGVSGYDGPEIGSEIEALRKMLDLSSPAAKPQDFWPEGYCKTCEGTGETIAGRGAPPDQAGYHLDLYLTSVPDRQKAFEILSRRRSQDRPIAEVEDFKELMGTLDNLETNPLLLRRHEDMGANVVPEVWIKELRDLGAAFKWVRHTVYPMFDICLDCSGTAKRGLPEKSMLVLDPHGPVEIQEPREAEHLFNIRHRRGSATVRKRSR